MVTSLQLYLAGLALVSLERLAELVLSRRNAARAFARGGVELGQAHFRVMSLVHASFLAACAIEAVVSGRPFRPAIGLPMIGLALAAQGLRWWAITSLGDAWNVRVIVVPGARAIVRGPYRWLRHPNYVAVGIEMFALPLIHGGWVTALVFSLANALVLSVRIRCEERALSELGDWAEHFSARGRFVPGMERRGTSPTAASPVERGAA